MRDDGVQNEEVCASRPLAVADVFKDYNVESKF